MKKIAFLAERAAERADPEPLDAGSVMAMLRGKTPGQADDGILALPLGYFVGGLAAAAAVALVVGFQAVLAWQEMDNPFTAVEAFLDVTEYMI